MEEAMNRYTEHSLGTIAIASNAVRISDPCYDTGVHCQGVIKNVDNGAWRTTVFKSDEGSWGNRCAVLMASSISISEPRVDSCKWEPTKIDVGVDSGQAGIYDQSAYKGGEDDYGDGGWYDDNCQKTLSDMGAGVLPDGRGVVSSSGYGDGSYTCSVIKQDGKVVAIKIDFLEEETEHCDNCGSEFPEDELCMGLCDTCQEEDEEEDE
jgi:hypothetical protein